MKDVKWSQIRRDYEHGDTFRKLAQIYGVSQSTISRRAQLEGWGRRGSAMGKLCCGSLERVAAQLAQKAGQMMEQQEETMSVKELRDMAALVRELTALQAAERESGSGASTVRVMLEGDVEKWSV